MSIHSAGIDIGSRTTKIVIIDKAESRIVAEKIVTTGIIPQETAWEEYNQLIKANEQVLVGNIFTTGYSKDIFPNSTRSVSEISCHARGVLYYYPQADIIIDIGGQDSKVIILEDGRTVDFIMNDKCAAGTGRFLELMASFFHTDIRTLSNLDLDYQKEISITSTCAVFTESEIVEFISQGMRKEDIIKGVFVALAKRIKSMLSTSIRHKSIVFTGGVANNKGIIRALGEVFDTNLLITPNPSITGALGAALFASAEHV